MNDIPAKDTSVRSLTRALAILQCFDLDSEELTLKQIADRLDLPPATVLRLMTCLTQEGFLSKSTTKSYSLGTQTYLLGAIASNHFRLHRVANPILLSLSNAIGEAISVYGIEGEDRVCYDHVESQHSMRCVVRVGERFPLWAGAGGKCLLAFASEALVERELGKLQSLTGNTIVDRDKFRQELELIRNTEEAVSFSEREVGITSTAVPIFSSQNKVQYTLSVASPTGRGTEEAIRRFIDRSKEAARAIAKQLYT